MCFWVLNEKIVFWVSIWELGDGIERKKNTKPVQRKKEREREREREKSDGERRLVREKIK